MAFEHMTPLTPETLIQAGAEDKPTETPAVETPKPSETPSAQATPPAEPPKPTEEPKPDEFIDTLNKRYSTTYKTDEEIKGLFSLPGKVTEYEGKLKDHDNLAKSVEQYKKELEETKTTLTSDFLSKPRIYNAYIAEQLIAKYPDRDPEILSSVAMSDIDKMSDIDAIAKERMITVKGLTFDEAKLAKLADFGIDLETKPEEWDSIAKARVKIAGAEARDRIKQLLMGIERPKVVTKEEREQALAKVLEDKTKAVAPIREIFKKFDTYKKDDFEFAVPDEFKSKLDDMFQGMFIDSGLDVNEENLATAEVIKKGLFLEEYLPKMLEVRDKQTEARIKAEYDAKLGNDKPLNTATATDQVQQPEESGVSNFLRNPKDERAKKF